MTVDWNKPKLLCSFGVDIRLIEPVNYNLAVNDEQMPFAKNRKPG